MKFNYKDNSSFLTFKIKNVSTSDDVSHFCFVIGKIGLVVLIKMIRYSGGAVINVLTAFLKLEEVQDCLVIPTLFYT